MTEKTCYDCKHCKMNKYYECFCHYNLTGAFTEHGKPVDSNDACDNFDYTDEDKERLGIR